MTKIAPSLTITIVAALLTLGLHVAPAQAQLSRSYVSPTGNDANNCLTATPCRSFQGAYNKTNAGGSILILGPASYGGLTITQSISIVNDGVGVAAIGVPSGQTGITINAGVNDSISLRGLVIDGGIVGNTGIRFNTGKSLTVENCVIRHVTVDGITFVPNATSSLSVSNSLVADNGNGIAVIPTGSGAVTAVFNRVQANNNATHGILVDGESSTGTVNATVYDSVAAGNGNTGFIAFTATSQALTTLMLFHSVAANNATGLYAQSPGATLRVAHSMVTGNANGWLTVGSGVLQSYGNNSIDGNTANEAAPDSIPLK